MSSTKDGAAEIVIIRRKSADEVAAHKGGAWKIAYADFVTAMMAFFLVMWLINAANEATRAQVASYFNPIKLTDSATGDRGLNDPKDVKSKERTPGSGAVEKATSAEKQQEQQALADPIKTLDRIAGASAQAASAHTDQAGGPSSNTLSDPFDPQAWQALVSSGQPSTPPTEDKTAGIAAAPSRAPAEKPAPAAVAHEKTAAPEPVASAASEPGSASKVPAQPNSSPEQVKVKSEGKPAKPEPQKSIAADSTASGAEPQAAQAGHDAGTSENKDPLQNPAMPGEQPDGSSDQPARLSQEIKAEILKKLNIDPVDLPANIEVKATPEGQLISLTDRTAFGMFQVGSSEPDPKLVAIVTAIAEVIKDKPGYLVIRGHTDARPYRNRHFDNWQLSAARAQMAYYMLLRGGVEDNRVKRIEGLADRDPVIPAHPDAPENRRIDILLGQAP